MILQIFKNNQEKYLKYFNPIRDHINHLYYKKEYKRLQQTTEYKIGKIIYSPIRLINRIFNKLFR